MQVLRRLGFSYKVHSSLVEGWRPRSRERNYARRVVVEFPSEDLGLCHGCGKVGVLGDGFCVKCWDRGRGG